MKYSSITKHHLVHLWPVPVDVRMCGYVCKYVNAYLCLWMCMCMHEVCVAEACG